MFFGSSEVLSHRCVNQAGVPGTQMTHDVCPAQLSFTKSSRPMRCRLSIPQKPNLIQRLSCTHFDLSNHLAIGPSCQLQALVLWSNSTLERKGGSRFCVITNRADSMSSQAEGCILETRLTLLSGSKASAELCIKIKNAVPGVKLQC